MRPAFKLPTIDGNELDSSALREPMLWLFWNPGCGYCQRMLDDLKRWELDRRPSAPNLLFISSGTAEQNRAIALTDAQRSAFVFQRRGAVGNMFEQLAAPLKDKREYHWSDVL